MCSVLNSVCCFLQKDSRRTAAKEHVRQKLQEHTKLTPQSIPSAQRRADDIVKTDGSSDLHDRLTKIKKCCVSFKLTSPGSVCSCRAVSNVSTNVCEDDTDGSEHNKEFVGYVPDEKHSNLLQSVESEKNLQPAVYNAELSELLTAEADVIKHDCSQSYTSSSSLSCNSVSRAEQRNNYLNHTEVLTQPLVIATPENGNNRCESSLHTSEKSGTQEGSSLIGNSLNAQQRNNCLHHTEVLTQQLVITTPENGNNQCESSLHMAEQEGSSPIANSLNASQKLQSSSSQNASSQPVSSNGCELNFSLMDEDLLACLPDNYYLAETAAYKKDASGSVCHGVNSHSVATVATDSVENTETSISSDDTTSLCQALSVVKLAVVESAKYGVIDFALPDSQYSEVMHLKVNSEDSSLRAVDAKNVVRGLASAHDGSVDSSCSSSVQSSQTSLTSDCRRSSRRLQRRQSHWYAADTYPWSALSIRC